MKIHEKYIKRCLQLAKSGLGLTRPNPMVGSVIVYNKKIIGEGFTSPYGGNHAEVNAINSVIDKKLLQKSTLYVSLEPCSHFGKTPPCSDLIIKHKIPKVVVGCVDPFEHVAGKGIEKLQRSGAEVIVGVLESECIKINKRFFTFHNKKRPYIILKWAETIDGFISPLLSPLPQGEEARPIWITNKYSRQLVHKWRAEEQAILVGTTTVIQDNPKLDVRDCAGENPLRLILDKNLRIPENYNLLDGSIKTIIFTGKNQRERSNLIYAKIDFSKNIPLQICDFLYKNEIQSLIVEGGTRTLQTFIDLNLWDEARIFKGNATFLEGIKAPTIKGVEISNTKLKSDSLKILKNT
ncbi:bifunctional diaminohydroxyphosphoribosylaminopyrimidine deaminase/5-amino-6-(5-phosphoribosylamino)uracil reductase RibD [Aureibaculum sp. 2210JD6-5]|uniref:bifunctional diaminohydroxyphosphoribosylaminopyrimidine deaminase/5-amino-6-(5-phosphoribosylamino)uracil reductase RibD n=1 Tax=Aureibaculum sp. 2210JD6-5 TaxID=3103957 RepID=UPI002AACA354|nr:bifunctional diaminohydroxyphosphoribosylaminopyrimidine deaminase/5-amino-6-(5-phosphoribosylamino)uracil reductase RibD [Aureibaculum sp. 2210JD6-5]MDY7393741.1 bifunctional diaminohydroxyphosphoribosylaminopyrimidine deaminase/5-amino-6-(5-phosphoribosylamino)uracil reductase RibD [Aureibaculum sp. 2210JD6-5]